MRSAYGVYVSLSTRGTLQRQLVTVNGEITQPETTPESEIMLYSELNFEPYAAVVDMLRTTAAFLPAEEDESTSQEEKNVYPFFLETVQDLVETFENEDVFHGTLTRSALEDCIPLNDESLTYTHQTAANILDSRTDVMQFQFVVNEVLYDMRRGESLDLNGKYSFLRRTAVTQILDLGDSLIQIYFSGRPQSILRVFAAPCDRAQGPSV